MIESISNLNKFFSAKVKNIRDVFACVWCQHKSQAYWRGVSIFKFSQLNWNYEYQFFDTETCEVSNILIILLAETRKLSKKGRERALHDWKGIGFMHTYAVSTRQTFTRTKAHKFPSTLNTHTCDILPCLQNEIGFLFPLVRARSCL